MMNLLLTFVPVDSLPVWLQGIARLLPLTYSVEALQLALSGGTWDAAWLDLVILLVFSLGLFYLSVITLTKRIE